MRSPSRLPGFTITTDALQGQYPDIPTELTDQYEELFTGSLNKKNKKIVDRLNSLILKYPQSPQLKNYLATAYNMQGNFEKAQEINKLAITEHPDYLFSKLSLALQYIADKEPQKVPALLGEAMNLHALYPDRELFHISEVTSFYKTAVAYYAAVKNLELAENSLEILKKLAPGSSDTKIAEVIVMPLKLEKTMESIQIEMAAKITVICTKPLPVSKQTGPPVFNNAAINNLYQYGLDIPDEVLREILALPRETLLADLEKILCDASARYKYFVRLKFKEQTHSFPLHAICLLAELKAENSLPVILDFFENNFKILNFWFGRHLISTLWLPVYLLGKKSPGILKDFLIKPGIETHAKALVTQALCQMAIHQPEKRQEVATIYKEVLIYFSQANRNDNIIDSDLIAVIIGDIIDCNFVKLLPIIKELFEKGYVNPKINGTYDEVEMYLKRPADLVFKKDIENIFELYKNILTNKAGVSKNKEDDLEEDEIQPPAVSIKIGRNDPCPCGSGKKYKKCCIEN